MTDIDELAGFLSATDAAALAGIAPDTFTAYVSRGQAPDAVGRFAGRRVWRRADIEQWMNTRPGRGYRRDLAGSSKSAE